MITGKVTPVGGLMGAAVLGVGITALAAACYDPPEKNTAVAPITAEACKATPGTFPAANCDSSQNVCTSTGCTIDPSCGSTSTCLPLADNAGKSTIDLRIRKLFVIAPATLATTFMQTVVITKNIDLNAKKCGESGAGSFNWLLRVDRTAGTLETGGAPPSTDPFGTGYCFYNHTTPKGIAVAPAKGNITFTGDTFASDKIPKLNVPIFLNGDVANAIVLPLSEVVIKDTTLSDGDNCVGKFDIGALDSTCGEDPTTCVKWKTNASLGGFIPLEDADKVDVTDLGRSLCVVLTGADGGAPPSGGVNRCPRDASGKLQLTDAQRGDYCSTSKQPGDCRDSFWLTATFAASAVKITDGAGVPECSP